MKVLVACDGSKPSRKALDKAAELAEKYGGVLLLLTVTEPVCPVGYTSESDCDKMEQILSAETAALLESIREELEKKALKVKTLVRRGNPADEIIKVAGREDADVVVVGSHGRHGAKKFLLGSVSSRVSTHAPCSVFIVK